MSSHREAPAISKDPVADNTDLYAFVSPDDPTKVTILANYIPLEEPAGGPNFFMFGDDVLYEIKIDNDGDGKEDIVYEFRFRTQVMNPNTFLYNVGPITSLGDSTWNVRQFYRVTRIRKGSGPGPKKAVLGENLASPPVNIGPRSTPSYAGLAEAAVHPLGDKKVFAGQRDEGFFVDLGSIFDLGTLRPLQGAHLISTVFGSMTGKDDTKGYNVHTIGIQVPKADLSHNGLTPTDPADTKSVIGIWATASRQKARVLDDDDDDDDDDDGKSAGPWVQVSRLGNPLINEVIIPLGKKDFWNRQQPRKDSQFLQYYTDPELQNLLPVLYPSGAGPPPTGPFGSLAAFLASAPPASRPRSDLVAILLTGIPGGVVPGFAGNFTGPTPADMLRLNMAIAPGGTSPLGLLGGNIAGFPNGRRVFDDAVAISLRAVAGIPGVAPFAPDTLGAALDDGVSANEAPFLSSFPYLRLPHQGFEHFHD